MIKYIIETRNSDGKLNMNSESIKRKEHPFLFSKSEFSIDELCHYASYGQDRNQPIGPMKLDVFMNEIGVSYRPKTW